ALSLAARYSDRAYGTIDNSDPVSQTFQGFGNYLVLDARAQYTITGNWSAAVGIDNLNNDKYFLFHPFPQRTFVMEIHYAQSDRPRLWIRSLRQRKRACQRDAGASRRRKPHGCDVPRGAWLLGLGDDGAEGRDSRGHHRGAAGAQGRLDRVGRARKA